MGVAGLRAHTDMCNCTIVQVINKITFTFQKKYIDILRSFEKDLSMNPSHTNSIQRHSNTRSTPLKLIYII